jgi:hypothetical protein
VEYPYFSEVIAVGMAFWGAAEPGRPLRHQVVVDFPNEPALLNYLALRQAQLMSDAREWSDVLSDLDELIERIDAETAHGS